MTRIYFLFTLIFVLAGCQSTDVPTEKTGMSENEVITELQSRLITTSYLLKESKFVERNQKVICKGVDFAQGKCFAPACAPCEPSAFKKDKIGCLDPGPLGTGLLCQVTNGEVSDKPCCIDGQSCELESSPPVSKTNEKSMNYQLFPSLTDRKFENNKCVSVK
ncbi:hypothetical protein [Vibrio penaeicida]|uniref:Lipoprotein n=1 Tax=Vibrio penaeicida TaxID=104609 RepID=A0AAV5NVN5_9VIBR|nr:hypothetical protein [Vibrio penaeicida]RTZ24309.1 hypothetical protein EKN09_04355 [Vibrio penaeicida]GLQ74329.1 hypothetical protein GCM10007932_36900 [Vibrio penaeicida]